MFDFAFFSPFRYSFFLFLLSLFFVFLCFFVALAGHKPFPYCFNKHLKCLAADLRCVYKTSAHPFAAVKMGGWVLDTGW